MKINTKNLWVTSDTHYSHPNICKAITKWDISTPRGLEAVRDFSSLEEMNTSLVENINSTVGENDTLLHLGDWSFGGYEKIQEFRDQINCKNIILILGNHDHHIQRDKGGIRKIFSHVSNYEEMQIDKKIKIVACHYPIISWNGLRQGSFMLHGHQHLKGEKRFGEGKRMDVGICGSTEFRPYHIDEITEKLKARKFQDPDDHHSED